MTKFNPMIETSMTTPEVLPDMPIVHAPKADWAGAASDLLQGFGSMTQSFARQMADEERAAIERDKDLKNQQTVQAGNELARQVLKANARLEQTGNRVQYDMEIRRLKDAANAAGLLKATDINTIVSGTDEGNLDISLESRKRFVKADDDAQIKVVNELRARYKSLNSKSFDSVMRDYNKITNNFDFAVELQNKMSQLDPVRYPEEYNRLKQERDGFFTNNVAGQVLLDISNDLETDAGMFKDPAKVEVRKQQMIESLVRNNVARTDAIMIVDHAFAMSGAYDVYGDKEAYLNLSKKDMQDIIDHRMTQETFGMYQSNPELYSQMAVVNTMGKDIYAEFSRQPGGIDFNKKLANNFVRIAQGNVDAIQSYEDKGTAVNVASGIMKGNYNPLFKGSVGYSVMADINNVGDVYKLDENSRAVVLSNTKGVVAKFNNPWTRANIQQLKMSPNTNERVAGEMLEKETNKTISREQALSYLQSPNEGGQAFRYLQSTIVADNLRVTPDGRLVYVAPEGRLEAIAEGIAEQFTNYGQYIDTINNDVQNVLGLKGEDLKNFWRSIDIPELSAGERPQRGPAFNVSAKAPKNIDEKPEENLTSEETQAESRELNKDLFQPLTASATTKSSETLANAFIDQAGPLPDQMVKEHNKKVDAIETEKVVAGVIAQAVREAEPDSEEWYKWMDVLNRINNKLKEAGLEPVDPYEDR